jgi:hypothetical protein
VNALGSGQVSLLWGAKAVISLPVSLLSDISLLKSSIQEVQLFHLLYIQPMIMKPFKKQFEKVSQNLSNFFHGICGQ